MSCTPNSTRAASELPVQHKSWELSCTRATAKQLTGCQTASKLPANRRARACAARVTPKQLRSATKNSQTAREPPCSLKVLRSRARPTIADPTASGPQNRQTLKVPNSTPCLETRPVAITEWELTTLSTERGDVMVNHLVATGTHLQQNLRSSSSLSHLASDWVR